jgi:hypothetical protein
MVSDDEDVTPFGSDTRHIESLGRVAVAVRTVTSQGIDTPEQYARFVERYRAHSGPR